MANPTGLHVLLAGGGTGGHVFPALAVGDELRARGWRVSFTGMAGGIEERLAGERGIPFHPLPARPLVGRGLFSKLGALTTLARSAGAAKRLIREIGADVVLGTGGYVSAPAVIGARRAGRPVLLLEPNGKAGVANRWLSRCATAADVGYRETMADLKCPSRLTGVPVRPAFFAVPELAPASPLRLLVLGGSQGARQINEAMPAAAKLLLARLPNLTIVHQAGAKNLEAAKAAYLKEGLDSRIEIVPFLDDVAGAMAASHLLVSRAGAITIAEICAAGRPSVLVPLAIAKAHQMDNARLLVEAGGAVVIPSDQFSPERLAEQIAGLLSGGPALEAMGRAARSLARPRAAADIADHLEEIGGALMFNRFTDLSRIHFVGIGGAGMSGIAEILLEFDLEVSGCDLSLGEATERLAQMGARIDQGHSPDHLEGVELVVISSAVAEDNPEVREARRRGITVVRRAEMLGELMRLKYGIGVAGTHGKTTTTSLVGTVLTEAGLDPTVIVGGRLRLLGTGARLGKSDYLIAEADEFDRSFLRLTPVIAVVTNIDRDHLDTYGSMEAIEEAFVEFANRVPFFGRLIVCLDDPNIQKILPRVADRRIITYGFSPQADLSAVDLEPHAGGSRFRARWRSDRVLGRIDLGRVELPIPGRHNVLNALAAIGVGLSLRIDFGTISAAIAGFEGVHRRFEQLGTWQGAVVVDDYAHHPTEVEATLQAARQTFPAGRVFAVFQPHLFSRTQDQAEGFGRALLGADMAIVTDVYPSREKPIPGVTGELVVEAAMKSGHRNVRYCPAWKDAADLLRGEVAPGDVVITLGAGDVNRLGRGLVAEGAQK